MLKTFPSELVVLILLLVACANVNQDSRDYYESKYAQKRMHHGFMPLSREEMQKLPEDYSELDEKKATRGKLVYEKACMDCHGVKGYGNGPKADPKRPPADLVKIVKAVPNFKIYMLASQWQAEMPGWQHKLSKDELEDLRHYILKLAKK